MKIFVTLAALFSALLTALAQLLFFLCAILIPFTIGVSVVFLPVPFFMMGLGMLAGRSLAPYVQKETLGVKLVLYSQCGMHRFFDRIRYPRILIMVFLLFVTLGSVGMFFLFKKN